MKSEKPVFTDFNFSFITFPRQVFVKFLDYLHNIRQKGIVSFHFPVLNFVYSKNILYLCQLSNNAPHAKGQFEESIIY